MPREGRTMRFCENMHCETPDEPIERISDYVIVDGKNLCTHCDQELKDNQEEWEANKLDFEEE